MMSQSLLRNLNSAQGRMDKLQNQMSSGLRISRPSDDPAGIQNAMRLKSNIASVEQWKNNADAAVDYMNTTDSTLGDMTSILQRVRELTVRGSNGSLATDDRAAIVDEVDQLSDQLRMMTNTQVGSKYIFSGTATDQVLQIQDPVTKVWTTQTPAGSDEDLKFEVGNNLALPISVNGQSLFGDATSTPQGVFVTLSALSAALKNNDTTAIDSSLGSIDDNINNIVALRADLGARTNRMTAIQNQLDSTSYNLQENLFGIEDADMPKTITDFTSQQNVYKAALAVGAKIIEPSLVDFLR